MIPPRPATLYYCVMQTSEIAELIRAVSAIPEVQKEPPPWVGVTDLLDSSVQVTLQASTSGDKAQMKFAEGAFRLKQNTGTRPITDVTLNVLSSLTLADLEESGAKNILREKLVNAYNQALGKKVADQVYFSDFVVQ